MAKYLDQTGLTYFWQKIKSKFLQLSGGTLTGADVVQYTAPAGTVVKVNANSILQSPIPKYLWHDLWAFCRATTPKFYTTTDGTTWTESTLEKRLFSHQEAWGTTNIITSNISGSRWEWDGGGFAYSSGAWLIIGVAYSATIAKFDVLLEASSGTGESATWTTLASAKNVSVNQQPIWIKTNGASANNIRLTITRNESSASTTVLPICSLRWLSFRWGNQGKGKEFEYPYTVDTSYNLSPLSGSKFKGNLTGNADTATSAASATKATQDGSGNVITSTYALKSQQLSTIANLTVNEDSGSMELWSANLNNIVTSGFYNAMTCTNAKYLYSTLIVIGYYLTGYCTQIQCDVTTGEIATRTQINGTWSAWKVLNPKAVTASSDGQGNVTISNATAAYDASTGSVIFTSLNE